MEIDVNILRSVATVASFVTFIGIVWKPPTCLLSRTDPS